MGLRLVNTRDMYCIATTKVGTPCKNKSYSEELCNMHWKIKHGKVLPQNLRKKNRSRMTDVMGMFGMKPREIEKLKKVFPELDEVMATKTDAQKTLLIVTKAIALRAVANPTPNTAKALMILSEPLINDSTEPEQDDTDDFWNMEA